MDHPRHRRPRTVRLVTRPGLTFPPAGNSENRRTAMGRDLNDIMEIDHVIRVNPDGTIDADPRKTHPLTPHAPESVMETRHDGQILAGDEEAWTARIRSEGWEPETGWTGQYG